MNIPVADRDLLNVFIRGRASDVDAQKICARVASEPDLARAYAELKLAFDRECQQSGISPESALAQMAASAGKNGSGESRSSTPTDAAPVVLETLRWIGWFMLAVFSGTIFAITAGPGWSGVWRVLFAR